LLPVPIVFDRDPTLEVAGYYPTVDPGYVEHQEAFQVLDRAAEPPFEAVLLFGPSGAGKTTAARQWAARRNRPTRELTLGERTNATDIVGGVGIQDGSTCYRPGAVEVLSHPGGTLILNELAAASQRELTSIWPFLEKGREEVEVVVEGRRIVVPIHPTAVVIATANELNRLHMEANGAMSFALIRRMTSLRMELSAKQVEAIAMRIAENRLAPRELDIPGGKVVVPDRLSSMSRVAEAIRTIVQIAEAIRTIERESGDQLWEASPELVAYAAIDAATPGIGLGEAVSRWIVDKAVDVHDAERLREVVRGTGLVSLGGRR
jgi:MoxR-like ATPase